MYVQSLVDPVFASIILKIEDRLRDLAGKKYLDLVSNKSIIELSMELCDVDALSPTELRAIRYLQDIHERTLHANRINPDVMKEATEIGERVVRIIDHRLGIV
jgi:tRNA G26 N,N-dimethylase Trm1